MNYKYELGYLNMDGSALFMEDYIVSIDSIQDENENMFMPDLDLTIVYEKN